MHLQIKNKRVNFETNIYENQDYEYNSSSQEEQEQEDYQQDKYYDDDDEYKELESSNNYHSNNNSVATAFEYKHDRLKKICSMALDLQTKLQQTKLKLFGANQNDDKIGEFYLFIYFILKF